MITSLSVCPSKKHPSRIKVRVHIDCALELLYCQVISSREVECKSYPGIDAEREWVELLCPLHLFNRFIKSPCDDQIETITMMGGSIAGVQFDSSFELLLRILQIPIERSPYHSKRG